MARSSPYPITLDAQERQELQRRAAAYTLPYYRVVRAKMILYAAQGLSNDQIAQRLAIRVGRSSVYGASDFTRTE